MSTTHDIYKSLAHVALEGNLEDIKKLLDNYELSCLQKYNLLCEAVKNNNKAITEVLLEKGCQINSINEEWSQTLLHLTALNGNIKIAKLLLDKSANINARDQNGRTPLHNAIGFKSREFVKFLLINGADVNATDNNDISPLQIAARLGRFQVMKRLLEFGANTSYICTAAQRQGYTPIHFAAKNGSAQVIRLLLNKGVNINLKGENDITPLHISSERGKEDAVILLLNEGADINTSTKDNLTPIYIATQRGHQTVVKILLQRGANVDDQDKNGKTILHLAVEKGYLMMVEDILQYFPDINNKSNRSSLKTAVHSYGQKYKKIIEALLEYGFRFDDKDIQNSRLLNAAIRKGYVKIVEDIIRRSTDINSIHNSTYKNGFTPLHIATKCKQEEVAKLLIRYRANINAENYLKRTPIFYAIENADLKLFKLLLNNNADIKGYPELLHTAVKKECIEIIEILLQHIANINAPDDCGRTALHFTILSEKEGYFKLLNIVDPDIKTKEKIAKLLLNNGADINAQTENHVTTLHAATLKGYSRIVETLLKYNANVESRAKHGDTPLHLGAEKGYNEIIQIILKYGANVNSKDEYGRTALHIAAHRGHIEVVTTLLEHGSDINITNIGDHTPLDFAKDGIRIYFGELNYDSDGNNYDDHSRGICLPKVSARALKYHIIKMKILNLYVSKQNLKLLGNIDMMIDFQNECEEEVKNMKTEKMKNYNISLYNIMKKDVYSLAISMKNETVLQALKSDKYKTKYPIYANMIKCQFIKGTKRKQLLEESDKIIHILFNNFPNLPHECAEKILSYLTDEDLKILINTYLPS